MKQGRASGDMRGAFVSRAESEASRAEVRVMRDAADVQPRPYAPFDAAGGADDVEPLDAATGCEFLDDRIREPE